MKNVKSKIKTLKEHIEFVAKLHKDTSTSIYKLLNIPLNQYYELKNESSEFIMNKYKEQDIVHYIELLEEHYAATFARKEDLIAYSIDKRIADLLDVLTEYYTITAIGNYVGKSDTHIKRILNKKSYVKLSFDLLVKLEDMYNGTLLKDNDVIDYLSYCYNKELTPVQKSKYADIESSSSYKEYEHSVLIKELPNVITVLNSLYTTKEISRRLEISNTYFHTVKKLNVKDRALNRVYNMLLVEFHDELDNYNKPLNLSA